MLDSAENKVFLLSFMSFVWLYMMTPSWRLSRSVQMVWHWKCLIVSSAHLPHLLMKQLVDLSLLLCMKCVSLCSLLLFPAFDFNRPNNNLISFFHAIYPRLRPVCGQTGTSTQHAAWHSSLTRVNEGQRATSCSWLLPLGAHLPDTLFTSPQPSDRSSWRLCDDSLPHIILSG